MTTKHILLVDDERAILSALKRVLKHQGYQLHTAESGADALALLEQCPIDLIISDMRMPQMNGAEFLRKAKQLYPNTVRILLTGHSDMDCTISAINDGGIFGYLSKPWDSPQLLELIDSALIVSTEKTENVHLLDGIRLENNTLKKCVERQSREMAMSDQYVSDTYQSLQDNYALIDEVLLNLLDLKHRGHREISLKVVNIIEQLSERLSLSESDLEGLKRCAKLYGIGKIGIPDTLLSLPRQALNEEQKQAYFCYPSHTASTLMSFSVHHDIAHILFNHKAYLDGTGYPEDINLERIPQLSKILMIAVDYVEWSCGLITGHQERHEDVIKALQRNNARYDDRLLASLSTLTMEVSNLDTETSILLPVCSLVPNMMLNNDLYSNQDTLLLRKNSLIDRNTIVQLARIQSNMAERMILDVRFVTQDESVQKVKNLSAKKAG